MKTIKIWPYLVTMLAVGFIMVGGLAYVAVSIQGGPTIHSKCVGNEFRAYWINGNSESLKVVYDNSCVDTPYVSE